MLRIGNLAADTRVIHTGVTDEGALVVDVSYITSHGLGRSGDRVCSC